MGYNENMPKAVVYGPTKAGGLGLHHLLVLQASQKIKHILQAYRYKTPLYQIMHTTFQWAQRVTGISTSIFEDTSTELPMLQNKLWISTLRHFLHQAHIKLHLPTISTPILQRKYDSNIMDYVLHHPRIPKHDIPYLNRCRLYLRVETIAGITNA